ncbi:DUF726-domain-containing protein [Schizopora paradoxa]|uniref:DUF726-domain-containing protein n=1 Tax=Schizopora paradoxa TaxID=27342 RepID=A0A0H2S8L0_9AGAM|nr:DUF726-domain-containing protein [Schizopora paradoxa]
MVLAPPKTNNAPNDDKDPFFDDDEEGWQDMPVVRDEFAGGLDDEDRKKFHYVTTTAASTTNATGNLIDFDFKGQEWREKQDANESEYTRLRLDEVDDSDQVHMRTKYLFDEDKAMTPLSQMQATKDMLTEAQRIAYVGLCALVIREMRESYNNMGKSKDLKAALESLQLWALKIMGRLYYHMELETAEQKMIDSLAEHGLQSSDLVPSLMTTHTVSNPEYDPAAARRQEEQHKKDEEDRLEAEEEGATDISDQLDIPESSSKDSIPKTPTSAARPYQTTANVLPPTETSSVPGVSTSLSTTDKDVTLDIRWTVLCDLFLILIADSVYDARSRVLLETIALKMGLGWMDVVKFEQRVTEALEIQEGVEQMEQQEIIDGRMKAAKKKRIAMLGLATLGGGLVIGLSAGLLAPVIGAGLGAAFATIGVTGTTGFLAGAGGAAVITTAGTLTGSTIAMRGMAKRTRQVRTFDLLPLHNNKRVNCILTVSGFMTSAKDDVRLPFSVLDPVVGDVFSVLWEPEMLGETGSALKILTSEVLTQVGQTVLSATVMTALMSALQWPILLTKLGYLIDNPWSNALDRAKAAGAVLADVLIRRHLGVRPITLIGFSLGARVIFYCLLELARQKAFGIVQDVFILGATLTAPTSTWLQARSVVSGRFVNGFARNDWVLNYLFRATNAGLASIAGLRPVTNVPGLENVDVTDKIAGHMSYRTFMPLILDQLGFPVTAEHFDEPDDIQMQADRVVVSKEEAELKKKKSWFSRSSKQKTPVKGVSRPPSVSSFSKEKVSSTKDVSDSLPERMEIPVVAPSTPPPGTPTPGTPEPGPEDSTPSLPMHAGFDFGAIQEMIQNEGGDIGMSMQSPTPGRMQVQSVAASASMLGPPPPYSRSVSVPLPPVPEKELLEKQRSVSARRDFQEPGDLPSKFDRALSLSESDLPAPEDWPEQGKSKGESGNDLDDPFSSRASAGGRGAVGRDAALRSPSTQSSERGGNRDAGWGPSFGGGDPFVGEDELENNDEDEYADFETGVSNHAGGSKPFGSGYPTTFGNGINHTEGQGGGSAFSGTAIRSPAMESTISFGGSVWGKEMSTFTPLGGSTLGSTSMAGTGINNAIGSPSIGSDDFGDFEVGSSRAASDPGLPALSFGSTNFGSFAGAGSAATLSFGNSDGFPIGGDGSEAVKRGEGGSSASDYWTPPPLPGQKKRSDTGNATASTTSMFSSNPWG